MHVAIPLYPRFTALDVAGPYTVLSMVPGCTVTLVAADRGPVADDFGTFLLAATASYEEVPAPDVIMVPGGTGTLDVLSDEALVNWIRQAHEHTRWTTSVCTGSLLLGAAGLLEGLPATSHWALLDLLKQYGAEPVSTRVVHTGKIVTAAGGVGRHRHGTHAGGQGRGRGNRAKRPAGHRVRPRAPVHGRQPPDGP
ncbi:DJ-1/PfpI family protein [Nonomuraea salmonea]|uniref:DJ-1/PfpI family protein n=1 Tax=Nonomuraea salmonea TaxID=46181 RepID=UPI002FECE92A